MQRRDSESKNVQSPFLRSVSETRPSTSRVCAFRNFLDGGAAEFRDLGDFFVRDPHNAGCSRAAIAALGAGEMKAILVPG